MADISILSDDDLLDQYEYSIQMKHYDPQGHMEADRGPFHYYELRDEIEKRMRYG